MVDQQLRRRGIADERVLRAMAAVPREAFVPTRLVTEAYADRALPIGHGQTISQPFIVARTCELASIAPEATVLELGSGSGYQAAVLGELCRHVVTIECIAELAARAARNLESIGQRRVQVVTGDGRQGYPALAPYAAIVVAAAAPAVPPALIEQLAQGGRLVMPVGARGLQSLIVMHKGEERLTETSYDPCVFVPLVGQD